MASNDSPLLFPTESFETSPDQSDHAADGYTTPPQELFEASIEQLRGTPLHLPNHLRRPHQEPAGPLHEPVGHRFVTDLLRRMNIPMEQQRRIPGCGINHFDPREDQAVCAMTDSPDLELLFGPQTKTYGRSPPSNPFRKRIVPGKGPQSAVPPPLQSESLGLTYTDRQPWLPLQITSPQSLSPFSSPSTIYPSPSYNRFQPLATSSPTQDAAPLQGRPSNGPSKVRGTTPAHEDCSTPEVHGSPTTPLLPSRPVKDKPTMFNEIDKSRNSVSRQLSFD